MRLFEGCTVKETPDDERRAGIEACRQVGENARPVSQLADELGVCWWTVMNAVIEHGAPLVDDPDRVGVVGQQGVDETSFRAATPSHPTVYTTGLIDLERQVLIAMVERNSAARAPPRRRHHLARTAATAPHPNQLSPLRRVQSPRVCGDRAGVERPSAIDLHAFDARPRLPRRHDAGICSGVERVVRGCGGR